MKTGRPLALDEHEPFHVAEAIQQMGVKHAVITSVNRDELKDGGAILWAKTITTVRELNPDVTIEVLIPDFKGNIQNLQYVIDAKPNILNHNTETVPKLYRKVRPQVVHWTLSVFRSCSKNGNADKNRHHAWIG